MLNINMMCMTSYTPINWALIVNEILLEVQKSKD